MTEAWTAPEVTRVEPGFESDERTGLEQWVDYHRATLLTKCAGLSAAQLKQRPVDPSRLSLLGLVRHMADVERWWFRMHAAQEDIGLSFDSDWSASTWYSSHGSVSKCPLPVNRACVATIFQPSTHMPRVPSIA